MDRINNSIDVVKKHRNLWKLYAPANHLWGAPTINKRYIGRIEYNGYARFFMSWLCLSIGLSKMISIAEIMRDMEEENK